MIGEVIFSLDSHKRAVVFWYQWFDSDSAGLVLRTTLEARSSLQTEPYAMVTVGCGQRGFSVAHLKNTATSFIVVYSMGSFESRLE